MFTKLFFVCGCAILGLAGCANHSDVRCAVATNLSSEFSIEDAALLRFSIITYRIYRSNENNVTTNIDIKSESGVPFVVWSEVGNKGVPDVSTREFISPKEFLALWSIIRKISSDNRAMIPITAKGDAVQTESFIHVIHWSGDKMNDRSSWKGSRDDIPPVFSELVTKIKDLGSAKSVKGR